MVKSNKENEKQILESTNSEEKDISKLLRENFTIPSEEEINNMEVLEKYGKKSIVTDFGILTGCQCIITKNACTIFNQQGYSANYYLRSRWEDIICYTGLKSETEFRNVANKGIRPIIKNADLIIDKKDLIQNEDFLEIELGEYPQIAADSYTQEELTRLKDKNLLYKTGRIYHYDKTVSSSNEFLNVGLFEEYKYGNKKFICVKPTVDHQYNGKSYDKFKLSNFETYNNSDLVWVEVKPVTWIYDESSNSLIARNILISGISYNPSDVESFDKTNLNMFLLNYMVGDVFQTSKIYTKKDDKNMNKYVEDFIKFAKEHPEQAKEMALKALIETGVLDKNGNFKEQIVTESYTSPSEELNENTKSKPKVIIIKKDKPKLIRKTGSCKKI